MAAYPARRLQLQPPPATALAPSPWARIEGLSRSRTAGHVVLGVGSAAFLALALLALFGESQLLLVDEPIQHRILQGRSGWNNRLMSWVSLLGTRHVMGAILLALTGWILATARCRRTMAVLLAAFALNFALEALLKSSIGRPRPDVLQLVPGNGPSFPSGHVLATVGFYGLLAVVAWKSTWRPRARFLATLAASALILSVAFSRIYLGVHWFSDVVAGLAVGSVFLLAVGRAVGPHHLAARRPCCRGHLSLITRAAS